MRISYIYFLKDPFVYLCLYFHAFCFPCVLVFAYLFVVMNKRLLCLVEKTGIGIFLLLGALFS